MKDKSKKSTDMKYGAGSGLGRLEKAGMSPGSAMKKKKKAGKKRKKSNPGY